MAADIVKLSAFRKAKARAEKEARAAENRARFGRTKAQREAETADTERRRRELDGVRRDDEAVTPTAGDTDGGTGPGTAS
jgi:hypothetical protein